MAKVTDKQINEWKEQHGGVYHLPIEDKEAYLKEPTMLEFKRAMSAMVEEGDIAFGESMLKSLWLGGDDAIKNDDTYFIPAKKALIKFFKYDEAEVQAIENNRTKITIGSASCIVRIVTRDDLKIAERKNPGNKPFVTQEQLFERIVEEKDEAFADKNNAEIRFPLYKAIEQLQNKKVAILKKL